MSMGRQAQQAKVVNLLFQLNTETMQNEQTRRSECAITR